MQVVIDIPDDLYNALMEVNNLVEMYGFAKFIANGMPLPKGHGDLIDKDHIITRLENLSAYFDFPCADIFDRRYGQGLKEAAIKVSEEKAVIPADKDGE